jgi:hypothetical protein
MILFYIKIIHTNINNTMSSPILPKNVNTNNLRYSEVKTLQSGAKAVYINYGTSKLRIQTPVMYLPYGIGEGFEDKNTKPDNKKKYDVTLSFKGHEENPKIESFLTKLREIESKIIDDAFENREPWFKDEFDGQKTFVARMFSPIVKIDKDKQTGKIVGKYPPTIRFKLPYNTETDKFSFDSFNMDGSPFDLIDYISKLKAGKAQLIVELNSLWFAAGKFGCTWKLITGKFQCSVNNTIDFIDDSDTEKNDEEEEDEASPPAVSTTKVENSDEEDEYTENVESNENNEEEVSAPPPVAEKKKATRGAKK